MKSASLTGILALLTVFATAIAASLSLDDFANRSQLLGQDSSTNRKSTTPESPQQMREGTVVNERLGKFRNVGERLEFEDKSDKRNYVCLENLWLQRVNQTIRDEDREIVWRISGQITEYMNRNYLLIERATRANPTTSANERN